MLTLHAAWVMGRLSSVHTEEQVGVKKDDGAQCRWRSCAAVPAVLCNAIPLPGFTEAVQLQWPAVRRGIAAL